MTTLATLPPLPSRDPSGHKGSFGTVAILGGNSTGNTRMIGAPALAAHAALRAGAGLVRLFVPAPILDAAITICPSATGQSIPTDPTGAMIPHEAAASLDRAAETSSALVVGPGLGVGPGPAALSLRAAQQHDTPIVLDADALNNLAEIPDLSRDFHAAAILTPHPGEYARLAASLNIDADPVSPDARPSAAAALAQRIGAIVVLKGPRTIVTDGQRVWTNDSGSAALATAGTGDVLAGLIGSLIAQFTPRVGMPATPARPLDLFQSACLAVHIHGLAADLWTAHHSAPAGLLASELADLIPEAMQQLRARRPA